MDRKKGKGEYKTDSFCCPKILWCVPGFFILLAITTELCEGCCILDCTKKNVLFPVAKVQEDMVGRSVQIFLDFNYGHG